MTAIPLNLAYQCKWCNAEELWLGHNCRDCGSKVGKCRSPKWERILATVSSIDNPSYTTQFPLSGTASQCCGTGVSGNNAFSSVNGVQWSDNPFKSTGVRCRYRSYGEGSTAFRKLCFVDGQPVPGETLYVTTQCNHWVYNLHWHYWSRLDQVTIYLSRLAEDSCKWRITLRVAGVHLLAHSFQYRNPVPPANCAGQYIGATAVYSGIKSISVTTAECLPAECDLLPNPDCAMPDYLTPSSVAVNLPGQGNFVYWMSKDVDLLTNELIEFDRNEDTGLVHCSLYPVNTNQSAPLVTCPASSTQTSGEDTNWVTAGGLNPIMCGGCFLQSRGLGGTTTVEVESNDYTFTQAIWDRWNVQFAFV